MSDDRTPSPPRKRPLARAPPQAVLKKAAADRDARDSKDTGPEQRQDPYKVHTFRTKPAGRFGGCSSMVEHAREIAHFSYDENREYRHDDSGINYYVPPPIGADLKEGFETFRYYDKQDTRLDSLLRGLIDSEGSLDGEEQTQADFVCWRGMMTKILTAPCDRFAEFSMLATQHDGTIYIEEDFEARVANRAADRAQQNSRQKYQPLHPDEMMTYWGYKFETLALIPTPPATTSQEEIASRQQGIVSNYAQHCSIVSTKLGDNKLILGGECDGLLEPKPADPSAQVPWVELKTSEEGAPQHKWESKLLRFWAQSFLLNVPTIIVGFRSKDGILKSVETFKTDELPDIVARSKNKNAWDAQICINFAAKFLVWLKGIVTPDAVYSIVLKKGSDVVEVRKVKEGGGGIVSKEFLAWKHSGAQSKKKRSLEEEDEEKEMKRAKTD